MKITRRSFLFSVGAACLYAALPKSFVFAEGKEFNLMVLGDSFIYGDGLLEDHKIYTYIKNWLQNGAFSAEKKVNLDVYAHSGARIRTHEDEKEALSKRKNVRTDQIHKEVSLPFPTIQDQMERAKADGKKPDLILLSAGITDIAVENILNPLGSINALKKNIDLYCYDWTLDLLQKITAEFPESLIALVGYYPIITAKSPTKQVWNSILEVYSVPDLFKPVLNNVLTRQFLGLIKKRIARRCQIWFERSSEKQRLAVEELNGKLNKKSVIFIASPLKPENGYAAEDTALWQIGKDSQPNDEEFKLRSAECREAIAELKKSGLKLRQRYCEVAAIGHPNQKGAKEYSEAIKAALQPFLKQ